MTVCCVSFLCFQNKRFLQEYWFLLIFLMKYDLRSISYLKKKEKKANVKKNT